MANPATQGAGALVAILHGSSWRTVGRDLRRRGFLCPAGRVSFRKRFPWSKNGAKTYLVATQIFFMFTPNLGEMIQFWLILFKWVETTNQKTMETCGLENDVFDAFWVSFFPLKRWHWFYFLFVFLWRWCVKSEWIVPSYYVFCDCSSWCEHPMMFLGSKNNLDNKLARWWVHFFIFTPIWGKIPILINICSRRLKPPTSWGGGFNPFEGISCTNH